MVQLLNSIYLGAATPSDYGKAAGVVELLPFDYYLGAAVPSHGKPTVNVLLSGVSPLTLLNAISLNYVKAFGKCEQDGTPTPTSPVDIVANNGVIKARHQSGLPLGYTLLDYTRSSATQYIDLGYKGNGNTKVEVKFKYYQTSNATGSGRVFGSRTNSTTNAFAIGSSSGVVASSDNKIFWCYDGQNFYVSANSFALGEWQTVLFSATEHKINGTIEGSDYTVTTFETPSNLMLFAFDNNATIGCGYVDIAYCKLWNNGVLVRDLVPAKNSLNEVGMYDLVSGQFLTNQGTGDFVAGNPVSDSVEIYYDGTVETANVYSLTLIEESDVTDGMGINSQNGIPVFNPDRCIFTPFFVKAGTKVIWSATASKLGGYLIQYSQPVAAAAYWISSITATPVEYVAGEYMRSATATEDCYVVCQGTASWEEMKNYNWRVTKLASTATCQPLLSVGTTKDVQNITNGEVTRKLGVYVVTGAEDWSYNDRYIRYQTTLNSLERVNALYEFLCTHGVSSTGTQGTWSIRTNKILAFYDNKSEFASLDIFKKFLADEYAAGHPAIIVYEKETPTTETVTGQTLTITQGTNVVTAEGSVDDLELEVSYKGYAEVTVEEIEAVNTDENVEVTIS